MGYKLCHALGWALPIDDLWSSPFFDGIKDTDTKHEYLHSILMSYKASDINQIVDKKTLPLWLRNDDTAKKILSDDQNLTHLIEFVGTDPDHASHVFFWPSVYGKGKLFRNNCYIDHALYGNSSTTEIKQTDEPFPIYDFTIADENGVLFCHNRTTVMHSIGIIPHKHGYGCGFSSGAAPAILRAWICHIGLLDLSRIAKIRCYAARYYS